MKLLTEGRRRPLSLRVSYQETTRFRSTIPRFASSLVRVNIPPRSPNDDLSHFPRNSHDRTVAVKFSTALGSDTRVLSHLIILSVFYHPQTSPFERRAARESGAAVDDRFAGLSSFLRQKLVY